MLKVLMNKYGDLYGFDAETNALINPAEVVHGVNIFVCNKDGQVISDTEVINFVEGDVIITVSVWDNESRETRHKAVVISDKAAKADFEEFFNKANKKNGTTEI